MIPAFNGDPWPGDAARYTLACFCLHRVRFRALRPRPLLIMRGTLISPVEDRERLQRAMRLLEWLGACARFAPIACALLLLVGCSSNTGPLAAADAADLGGSGDVAHVLQPRDAGELELEDGGDAGDEHQVDEHQVDAGELELEDAGGDAGDEHLDEHQVDAGELEDAGAHVDAGNDAGAGGFDCAATTCPGGFVCLACAGCVPIGFACEGQP